MDLHQLVNDRINVPVVKVLVSGRNGLEHLGDEGAQVLAQEGMQDHLVAGIDRNSGHLR
jgi:hypothetical protein